MTEILQALWFSGFVVFMWWATWEDSHKVEEMKYGAFLDELWYAWYMKKELERYTIERLLFAYQATQNRGSL